MKLDQVAASGNDEFYTPLYAIEPLVKYIPQEWRVWCPFDTEASNIANRLDAAGNAVTVSHIEDGFDFFTCEAPDCDVIISNPPYSRKGDVFASLFSRQVRFAMLVGVVGLFESAARFNMFKGNAFEIMFLSKRIAYFKSFYEQKPSLNPPFSSVWITRGVLPQAIVFEEVEK